MHGYTPIIGMHLFCKQHTLNCTCYRVLIWFVVFGNWLLHEGFVSVSWNGWSNNILLLKFDVT